MKRSQGGSCCIPGLCILRPAAKPQAIQRLLGTTLENANRLRFSFWQLEAIPFASQR
jgi:hypothetical protein